VNQNLDSQFELGQLYCDRGDFVTAIDKLQSAALGFYEIRDFTRYLQCQNLLLRMYAEREEPDYINATKEKIQDLVLKEGFELSAKTYYTLALCATYKGQHDTALDYLQKSLTIALSTDRKDDICYAITGIAWTYYNLERYSETLKEVYNLQVFFQVLDIPDLRTSVQILNGNILRKTKKYEQALDVYWQCYDIIRETKRMTAFVSLLYCMGQTYKDMGEKDLARMYLQMALKSVDADNMKRMAVEVQRSLEELGGSDNQSYDLIFNTISNSVVERKLGKIDFKNQFILLDLLRLFVQNPGQVYSKEYLVEHVWRQNYDPAIHDNKIYVTIKRLRKMIEPDYEKPKYIFRAKNGYYLNKSARILLDQ
jgi:tetratricopeptide (TPR) repeat protein